MYNKELFFKEFQGLRRKNIFLFCENKKDWFLYDELFQFSVKQAGGGASKTARLILFLIKIGFLLADPQKGLKVNPDFIPKSQQPLLK